MWSSFYSYTTATPNMTQMTWHGVSPTVSRSLLQRADQNPEKTLAVLPAPHSSLAQVHKCVQICVHSPRTPLSLSAQTGPSRVSWWECKLLVRVTPKCHEHSALSKNTSSVKVSALNKHQLGALTILLQICRRKLSPALNKWTATSQSIHSVTDQKDQAAKRKFAKIIFPPNLMKHFALRTSLLTSCISTDHVSHLSNFILETWTEQVLGVRYPCQLFQKIFPASLHKDLQMRFCYMKLFIGRVAQIQAI